MNFGTNSQILMKVSFLLSRRIYQFSSYKLEHAVACYIHKHKVNIPFLPILRVETTETGIFPSFCSLVFMLIKQNPDLRQSMLENQQDKQLEDTNRPAPPTNPDKGVARAGCWPPQGRIKYPTPRAELRGKDVAAVVYKNN